MLALYRSGRQSEALEVYQGLRRRLDDELGLQPGAELQALERQILQQDADLQIAPVERQRLPTGTVTFVFTDIEGSTSLLQELGAEEYARALAEHRRILREAFAAHDGVEVDTQGDAFLIAFSPGAGCGRGRFGRAGAARRRDGACPGRHPHRHAAPHRRRLRRHGRAPGGPDHERGARRAGLALGVDATAPRRRRRALRDLGLHRLKDLGTPATALPARGRRLPATAVAQPVEPAAATDPADRTRDRARGDRRVARPQRVPARHAHRARRQRQDAARAAGGRRGGRSHDGRGVLGLARPDSEPRARRGRARAGPRRPRGRGRAARA